MKFAYLMLRNFVQTHHWRYLLSVALLFASVPIAACGQTSISRDKAVSARPTEKQLIDVLQESDRIRSLEVRFQQAHPFKQSDAATYIQTLRKEGFSCRVQYRDSFFAGKGEQLGQIFREQVPAVECLQAPSRIGSCQQFRVAMRISWLRPEAPLKEVVAQLHQSSISRAIFVCESEPSPPEFIAWLKNSAALGEAVFID